MKRLLIAFATMASLAFVFAIPSASALELEAAVRDQTVEVIDFEVSTPAQPVQAHEVMLFTSSEDFLYLNYEPAPGRTDFAAEHRNTALNFGLIGGAATPAAGISGVATS